MSQRALPEPSESLAALIALLRPRSVVPKLITGAGAWSVRYAAQESTGFCIVLEGSCFVDAGGPLELARGDFLLFPQTPAFTIASDLRLRPRPVTPTPEIEIRRGDRAGPASMRMLGGYFLFDRANAQLLVRLLPPVVHIRRTEAGAARLRRIVALIGEEAVARRPGRDAILERLVEVLLVEALRFRVATAARPEQGLLAGLSDPALARPLRGIHVDVARRWTVAELARNAGMSRAVFAERFMRTVGMPPMQYLLEWRMAIAKDMLRRDRLSLAEVAERVGYQSTSAFSTAFARLTGRSPSAFARARE